MIQSSAQRRHAPDVVEVMKRYHDATNALDYETLENVFSETAVYISDGVGVLEGRDAILAGFRGYFAEYGDQVAEDETVEAISPRAAKSVWKLRATSSRTGQTLIRAGEETIFLDAEGLIEKVIVRDRTPR